MHNPINDLTKKEWLLWISSLLIVGLSNLFTDDISWLTLAAALIGVSSLMFAAKGNVWSQILMIVFSILYGVISWQFRYWGEMITYLGMSMPMAIWSAATWIRNPSKEDAGKVSIQRLTGRHWAILVLTGAVVTGGFYFILKALDTPNLAFSTVSIATSFLAAALTMLRSSYYALGYAANDLVLIVLWVYASVLEPEYIPIAVNFAIFFFNDMYGFFSWRKRELSQQS